ncbi:MAG: hypothetical protein JXB30_18250 [Anaerolineae bacterium]|nr:hypothetical protein [Anaerolineae bacterium]
MTTKHFIPILVGTVLIACNACASRTPTTTLTPTAPAATATRAPRPTTTPTMAPSATPDVPLYDDGAWLLFQGWDPDSDEVDSHLWAVNWDGTGLTDLLPDFFVWQYEVQPIVDGSPGRYVAAITSYGWSAQFMFTLAHLPDGKVVANIPLTNPQTELVDYPTEDDADYRDYWRRAAPSMSISDLRSLAWSPDGTRIAFSGAQDGTQTDVYVLSLTDGSVSRLTWDQHQHHASNLLWSSDGQYVAYDGVSSALGTYPRYRVDGIWVVRADGSGTWQVASEDEWPTDSEWSNRPQKQEWTSNHTIAAYALNTAHDSPDTLREIDVETGRSSTIFDGSYCGAAFSPEQGVWLVSNDTMDAYLIKDGVTNKVEPLSFYWPIWSADLNAFVTKQGLVNTDGKQTTLDLPWGLPLVSPDGAYWAYPDLWIGEIGKQPRQISDARFGVLQWSSNSRSVLVSKEWVSDDKARGLQYVAIAPDFELRPISQYVASRYIGPWMNGLHLGD